MHTRKRIGCLLVHVLAAVFVFTGIAMSAQKKPATVAELALYDGADRQQILEEGARKEGKLTFYTTSQEEAVYNPKLAAFQKKYPYIKVEMWRASSTNLLPRVVEEYMAGRNVVDIIELSQVSQLAMEDKGILQPFYSPNFAFIHEGAIRKAPGSGAFAAGFREGGYGLAYNTKLIARKEIPKT